MWKERPHVLPIYSSDVLMEKIDYLHRNPVRAGLVETPELWQHSSFRQMFMDAEDVPFQCDDWRELSL